MISAKIKEGNRIAYVIADINGLKQVNDSLGHLVGDKLVESVANILNKVMTNAFRVYRIGGDEFVIIYFNKNMETVRREVTLAYEQCDKIQLDDKIPVGASFGYAEQEEGEEFSATVHRADIRMYSEKEKFYKEKGFERRKNQ